MKIEKSRRNNIIGLEKICFPDVKKERDLRLSGVLKQSIYARLNVELPLNIAALKYSPLC